MSALSWWRSWHGAPTDHKWQVISVRSGVKVGIVSAVAWALLDYASQHKERGTVEGFDTEMYAVYSGFDETEVVAVIKAMVEKGIIVDGKLSAWEKRQPKREDDSTPRVNKFREKKRNETQGNAPDKEEDKENRLTDTDEEERIPQPDDSPSSHLEAAFVEATKMNGLLPSPEKAYKAYKAMQDAGVEPQDLINAVHILMQKKYTIVGPSSVVNTAINEMSQRLQSGQTNFRKRPGMMPDGV